MAANNIKGLTLEIGGDTTKLGKALENVTKRSTDLSRELGQINKMLKLDPGNADLLAQKQKVLAEAVETTSEKLRTLREAERQVQKQFERGEVSEAQVRELQREIIATEKKLKVYEDAARETADAVDKMGDSTADVKADAKKAEKGADEASDALDDLTKSADKTEKSSSKMGAALSGAAAKGTKAVATAAAAAAAAAGAAAGALASATMSAASSADEILTLSSVTGIATDDLQAFKYASELVDVDLETLTKSMAKNVKSMSSASQGSKLYADAYKKLGVSVTDANGNLRDGETVYWETLDALGQMTNETERDAVAMQLFGRSAQELNPLIEAGADKMQALTQEARDVGAVMGEETLGKLGEFDDTMQRLKGTAGAAKNALGGVLLPELQLLAGAGTDLLADFTEKLNASGGGLDGLVSTIDSMQGEIVGAVTDMATQLLEKVAALLPTLVETFVSLVGTLVTKLTDMFPMLVDTVLQVVTTALTGIFDLFPKVVEAAGTLMLELASGILEALPQVVAAFSEMIPRLVSTWTSMLPQVMTAAISLISCVLDAVMVILPVLVEQAPKIVMTVVDVLLASIPLLLDTAVDFLLALVDAIPILIGQLVPALPQIVSTIILGLMDCVPALLDAAVTLLLAIVEAVPMICVELIKALPQIWLTMFNHFKQMPVKLWNILVSLVQNFVRWGVESRKNAMNGAKNILLAIVGIFGELPGKIWTWLVNAVNKVGQWGSNMVAKARSGVQRMVTAVVNAVKGLPSKMVSAGKNLVEGLWQGIKGGYTWLKNKISGWVGDVTDFIKGLFGIHSPSKVTAYMGEMLDAGLAEGIEDNTDQPMRAMRGMSDALLDEGPDGLSLTRQINHSFGASASTAFSGADMLGKLDQILVAIQAGQVIALDGKTLIGSTAAGYDSTLGQRRALAARGAL